jgi:site-specific DNA recombinase
MANKVAAIYVRVSTNGQKFDSQEPDLKRWAESYDGPVHWYRDKFTGKTMDRPGWQKLWQAVEEGKIGLIVVWRLDRFGRTTLELVRLRDDLVRLKIGVHSLPLWPYYPRVSETAG